MPNFSQELPWQRQKLAHEEIPFLLALRSHQPAILKPGLDRRFDRKAPQAISSPLRAVLAQPTVPPLL